MGWAIHNLAGAIAGTRQASRVAKRKADHKRPESAKRARDEFDQSTDANGVEHAEAVRSLKDNTQEEAHEDRQEHGAQQHLASESHEGAVVYGPERAAPAQRRSGGGRVDLSG